MGGTTTGGSADGGSLDGGSAGGSIGCETVTACAIEVAALPEASTASTVMLAVPSVAEVSQSWL